MIAVLLVLMALFVFCAPFLLTVRNADRASVELADRATARIALEDAERHARAELSSSHLALDKTPYHDSVEELDVENRFPEGFLDPNDPTGVMWDLEVEDVAGRIDLNSASPHVIANLFGSVARLVEEVLERSEELPVNSTSGFLAEGVVWLSATDSGRELVAYAEHDGARLQKLARGLGVKRDSDGQALACGPQPPHDHPVGAYVIDQRAYAIPLWRMLQRSRAGSPVGSPVGSMGGEIAFFDSVEQAAEAIPFAMAETLGPDALALLDRATSVHAGIGAGPRWERGARLTGDPRGEPAHGCELPVDDARFFNAGTTVRIRDGDVFEFGLVVSANAEALVLQDPLVHDYEPFRAVVQPLARRPVDINTASPEVLKALFWNLKLRGKGARITSQEADALVEVIGTSRPFTGFEDFLRRVVLPAGGFEPLPKDAPVVPEVFREPARPGDLGAGETRAAAGFLDPDDALALYKNAVNANDAELEFSTMPICFVSRDVYAMELRTAVNATSGVERTKRVRELVELVVPQRDLLRLWARQEDFDEELRLGARAPGWLSGPEATYRFDRVFQSACPTRVRAHLGPHDTREVLDPTPPEGDAPAYVFPSRDDTAYAALAPARADEEGQRAGRALHFDDETRGVEGRYLPDGPLLLTPDKMPVSWGGQGGTSGPLSFELWLQPRELEEGAIFFDAGGRYTDSDRVSLLLEGGDLVLRVLDGGGDHPASAFQERAEIRYAIAGEGAGLPRDVWTHVEVAAQGNKPSQMRMLVDGRASARTPGLTWLTSSIPPDSDTIPVDSTEGFPERCVLRIGDELVEAEKEGEHSFQARFSPTGESAGFGGRLARERFDVTKSQSLPEQNLGLIKNTDHPAGASVELYGYSLPLHSNVPHAGGALVGALGRFGVARVTGIVQGGSEKTENKMEPITLRSSWGWELVLGHGLDGLQDDVEALVLEAADPDRSAADVAQAFSQSGGYAALLSITWTFALYNPVTGQSETVSRDKDGTRLGGVEVIRYARMEGNRLVLERRGDRVAELENLRGAPDDVAGRGAFVVHWTHSDPDLLARNHALWAQVMVVPISAPVQGASGLTSFLPAQAGASEFAQITHLGAEAHLTEWVRYDEIEGDFLVRDAPLALQRANLAAHAGIDKQEGKNPLQPPPPPPGGTGIPGGGPRGGGGSQALQAFFASAPSTISGPQGGGNFWHYAVGVPEVELEAYPVTRAVASQFQFRGVLGTYSHAHGAGTPVLPVWKTPDIDETAGLPGRFDHVMFLDPDAELPAFPGVVHHAHRPLEYATHSYQSGSAPLSAQPGVSEPATQDGFDTTVNYVALEQALAVPVSASTLPGEPAADTRGFARIAAFPSGEGPREVISVALGSDRLSPRTAVAAAVIDEVVFGTDLLDYQLVVAEPGFSESAQQLKVRDVRRTLGGDLADPRPLAPLPPDAGLLRIGSEIVCYDRFDADGNEIHVPAGGRGMLGTQPRNHVEGTSVRWLESWRVSTLGAGVGALDSELALTSREDFPKSGTVLIDEELVHYTHFQGDALSMPRGSEQPGAMDRKGRGLFRGRYGTTPAGHGGGTPVVLFPFRYWDRWAERADAPELHYFEFSIDQPDAFWKRSFFGVEDAPVNGPRIGALEKSRPEVYWDSDPQSFPNGLALRDDGKLESGGSPIGVQSDRIAWRVFVRHEPGSFDPRDGLAHGWKTTPRLRLLGAEYIGPNRVLRRVER